MSKARTQGGEWQEGVLRLAGLVNYRREDRPALMVR